jgi:hypothetical protein
MAPNGSSNGSGWRGMAAPLLLPTWAMIGIFLLLPVILMAVYSFLTKEFRGGVVWEFSLAAYDQFFVNRGLFGDEPATLEWTYISIFWRSIWQAAVAAIICLIIGFPTAWFIATRPPRQPGHLAVSDHHPLLGQSADPHSQPEIPDPRQWSAKRVPDGIGRNRQPSAARQHQPRRAAWTVLQLSALHGPADLCRGRAI